MSANAVWGGWSHPSAAIACAPTAPAACAASACAATHRPHVRRAGPVSPGIVIPVMATAVTDLERLLRVTVVHSPLVPPKEAKNLHHGSFVLLPDSSLSHQAVNTLSRAGKDVSFGGPVGERYPTAARLAPANVALRDCGKDRLHGLAGSGSHRPHRPDPREVERIPRVNQTNWQKASEWPLTISALAFLAAYAIPIINHDIPPAAAHACEVIVWATWVLFGLDFIVRVVLADHRPRYILLHWLDVLIIALPLLRGLRLLRLASLLAVLNRHAPRASSEARSRPTSSAEPAKTLATVTEC